MFNQSRRKFIKGAAYSSALAIGGLSSLALVESKISANQTVDSEVVVLINHTASNVDFDGISGANLSIAPGEQRSFLVAAISDSNSTNWNSKHLFITDVLQDHLAISSEYSGFNGIFPNIDFQILDKISYIVCPSERRTN